MSFSKTNFLLEMFRKKTEEQKSLHFIPVLFLATTLRLWNAQGECLSWHTYNYLWWNPNFKIDLLKFYIVRFLQRRCTVLPMISINQLVSKTWIMSISLSWIMEVFWFDINLHDGKNSTRFSRIISTDLIAVLKAKLMV